MNRCHCHVAAAGILLHLSCLGLYANPNHKVLDTPLAIHGKGSSPAWHAEASKLYADARRKLLIYLEKEKDNAIRTINAEDLGKTHLMVTMVSRGGGWLETSGEPAGTDFKLRATVMHSHLGRIIGASQTLPSTQKYMDSFRQYLVKSAPARAKALANIEKLCNDQKWEAAEVALFKVYDTLEPGIIFLPPPERAPIYEPFIKANAAILHAMTRIRATASEEELKTAMKELTPDYKSVQAEMDSAVNAIAANGNASWGGETVTGPQLVEKIAQTWRETQVRVQQIRGKNWALLFRQYSTGMYHETVPFANQSSQDPIADEFATFSQHVMDLLVRLIEAEGKQVSAHACRNLYVEYLRALAPIVRQTNNAEWKVKLEKSLTNFHKKDPALDREVKAYAAATADLLRWRARLASAQAAVKETEFLPVVERFHDGTVSGPVDGVQYTGLFPAPPAQEMQPQLMTASPDIMPIAIQRLVGQKTMLRDVVRIAPDSKVSIARYSQRTYANVPAPLPISGAVESLRADLLVSEQAPPLTLEATYAIITAERGDMIAIGGEISGLHLEAVVTRFAALPVSAALLSPLGQIPTEKFDGSSLRNMLMRFEVTPLWARHDYFFVPLTPPSNLTASR